MAIFSVQPFRFRFGPQSAVLAIMPGSVSLKHAKSLLSLIQSRFFTKLHSSVDIPFTSTGTIITYLGFWDITEEGKKKKKVAVHLF